MGKYLPCSCPGQRVRTWRASRSSINTPVAALLVCTAVAMDYGTAWVRLRAQLGAVSPLPRPTGCTWTKPTGSSAEAVLQRWAHRVACVGPGCSGDVLRRVGVHPSRCAGQPASGDNAGRSRQVQPVSTVSLRSCDHLWCMGTACGVWAPLAKTQDMGTDVEEGKAQVDVLQLS